MIGLNDEIILDLMDGGAVALGADITPICAEQSANLQEIINRIIPSTQDPDPAMDLTGLRRFLISTLLQLGKGSKYLIMRNFSYFPCCRYIAFHVDFCVHSHSH